LGFSTPSSHLILLFVNLPYKVFILKYLKFIWFSFSFSLCSS
jgi:hypothetical protein